MLKDNYVLDKDKTKEENKDKVVISNEAYAIGETIERLINILRKLETRLNNG